jgi:putative membrane protein
VIPVESIGASRLERQVQSDYISPRFYQRGDILISNSELSIGRLVKGTAAGFVATAPMSVAMLIGWMLLPKHERYQLPPRLITEEISERVGIEEHMTENQLVGLTIFSHFGYGALFGAVYALFHEKMPMHSSLKGTLAGLTIWVGSYLGWLPAMGILSPATQHPWRRNLLMILAHVVWGVTLGEITRKLTESN